MMNLKLIKGSIKDTEECVSALENSELGRQYFSRKGSARETITEGINANTLYIAEDNGVFKGFVYYIKNGAFHGFPYIHLLVTKPSERGSGIGSEILSQLEAHLKCPKIFLVVADFNPDGIRFYEKNGYVRVGRIEGLYRDGIAENIMMKTCNI